MSWWPARTLKRQAETRLDAELRDHVERLTADYRARGMSDAEARRRALVDFGGVEHIKDDCRDERRARWLDIAARDVRHAFRVMRRSPGFTVVTVLCLSLGIGANAAVFSVFSSLLLRPLPYNAENRLGILHKTSRTDSAQRSTFGPAEFFDWRDSTRAFDSLAMYVPWSPSLREVAQAEYLTGVRGSGDLFQALGIAPLIGRTFSREDEISGARVVVISHRLWQRSFQEDPALIGRDIRLDGQRYVVIGVMPAAFQFPDTRADVWSPLTVAPNRIDRGETGFPMLARLRLGASWDQAKAEINTRLDNMRSTYAKTYDDAAAELTPVRKWLVGSSQRQTLWLLLGAVGLVLLTACTNVTNLMLAHGGARRQEILVRLALGATRRRVICQLLTEYAVLGAVGCVLGVLLSLWARDAFVNLLPASSPYRLMPVALDWRVLVYSIAVSLTSVVIAGLIPALRATRSDLSSHGQRLTRVNVRAALLAVQTAAAVVLLAGGVLLVRSFMNVWNIDPGFSRSQVVTTRLVLAGNIPPAAQTAFYDGLLARLESAPAIGSAGAASFLPLGGEGSSGYISIESRPDLDIARGTQPGAARLSVSPGFFKALSVPIVEGRPFSAADSTSAPVVAIVNRALADKFFPHESPIGRRIKRGTPPAPFPWMTIVGVVGDVKLLSLFDDAQPTIFLPHTQAPTAAMALVMRTSAPPEVVASQFRSAVHALDPTQPIGAVRSFDDVVLDSLATGRFPMLWIASFSILALALCALGVHGVVSYALLQRQREFVIRLVLGARPLSLVALGLRHGLWPTAIGCAIGLAVAIALTRLLSNLVYGIDVHDPASLAMAFTVPFLVALASSYPAVRRVAKAKPATILHFE